MDMPPICAVPMNAVAFGTSSDRVTLDWATEKACIQRHKSAKSTKPMTKGLGCARRLTAYSAAYGHQDADAKQVRVAAFQGSKMEEHSANEDQDAAEQVVGHIVPGEWVWRVSKCLAFRSKGRKVSKNLSTHGSDLRVLAHKSAADQ